MTQPASPVKHQYFSFPPYQSPKKAPRPKPLSRPVPFLEPTYAKAQSRAKGVNKANKFGLWPSARKAAPAPSALLKAPGPKAVLSPVTACANGGQAFLADPSAARTPPAPTTVRRAQTQAVPTCPTCGESAAVRMPAQSMRL